MSPGTTDTFISNGVEDIRGITIHLTTSAVILSEHTIVGQALRLPGSATDAVALQLRETRSENVKSSHQFLTRFHRLRWIHPAEHFFPAFAIHCSSSCTSRLRAFHFAYLPAPIPSASRAETIQTVMSVEVTRSISIENRSRNVPPSQQSSNGTRGARRPARPFRRPR